MTELEVRFHDVGPHEPPEWQAFRATGASYAFLDWSVLRAMAEVYRGTPLAGTFHDDGRVVGVVVGRLRGVHVRGRARAVVADLDCPPSSATQGITLIGAVPGTGLGPDDLARHRAAIEALESALRSRWGSAVRSIWYRQVYAEMLPIVQQGMAVTYSGKTASVLQPTFADWDTYLKSLRKSRRDDVKRLLRAFDNDPDIDVSFGHDAAAFDAAEIAGLGLATAQRRHQKAWPPVRAMPEAVVRAMLDTPGTRVLRYARPGGELIGSGLLHEHATTPVIGQWAALDAKTPGVRSGLWFDHMARMVRAAVHDGAEHVLGGKGSDVLKEEFGFTSVPQWTVARRLAG